MKDPLYRATDGSESLSGRGIRRSHADLDPKLHSGADDAESISRSLCREYRRRIGVHTVQIL